MSTDAALPPLPPELQAALDRAASNMGETMVFTLTRPFGGEEFDFKFYAGVPSDGIALVGKFQRMSKTMGPENIDVDVTLDLVVEFLDIMATPATANLIAHLMRARLMGFADLIELQTAVMERASGRPFTKQPSSPEESPATGPTSTAGAALTALTPPPSPTTAS